MRFTFPDYADFPEFGCPANEYFDSSLPEADSAAESVLAGLDGWARMTGARFRNDPEAQGILEKQVARIRNAAQASLQTREPAESEFTVDGIISRHADTGHLADLFAAQIESLRGIADYEPRIDQVDRAHTRTDPEACHAVSDFLAELGIIQQVWAHRRDSGFDVRAVTIHVSRPGDRHHYQQFRDCATTTKLLNLHVDPKPGVMKAIIYLDEVTEKNGPFKAIRGSHHWEVDEIERIFAWGNSVGNYCHTPKHRKVMAAFPERFRKSAVIGRLIPDGSELSDFLVSHETSFLSKDATVMAFDPCFVFHRGGQCEEDERVNLQVVMK